MGRLAPCEQPLYSYCSVKLSNIRGMFESIKRTLQAPQQQNVPQENHCQMQWSEQNGWLWPFKLLSVPVVNDLSAISSSR